MSMKLFKNNKALNRTLSNKESFKMRFLLAEGTYAKNHRYENTHIIALTNTKCAGDLWFCCRLS